jgi:hypothetical protein
MLVKLKLKRVQNITGPNARRILLKMGGTELNRSHWARLSLRANATSTRRVRDRVLALKRPPGANSVRLVPGLP